MSTDEIKAAAAAMGRLGRGVRKTLTDEQRKAAGERLRLARLKRWPAKPASAPEPAAETPPAPAEEPQSPWNDGTPAVYPSSE